MEEWKKTRENIERVEVCKIDRGSVCVRVKERVRASASAKEERVRDKTRE